MTVPVYTAVLMLSPVYFANLFAWVTSSNREDMDELAAGVIQVTPALIISMSDQGLRPTVSIKATEAELKVLHENNPIDDDFAALVQRAIDTINAYKLVESLPDPGVADAP